MNFSRNKPERDLSELKVRYQVLCYVTVFGCITGGFLLGMFLLLGSDDVWAGSSSTGRPAKFGVLFVFGLLAVGSVGAYLGMRVTDRVLAWIFALCGHVKRSDIGKRVREVDFPKQWLK